MQEEGDRNVRDFLLNVAPLTLEGFLFYGDIDNKLNASFYLEGLHSVFKSTTREVKFNNCIFSCSELQSIFIAAKHIKTLWFNSCKLDVTDEFDIKEDTFNIEELQLWDWIYNSGWSNNIDGLEILVKAVANSSLKHSLKIIWIWDIEMDIENKYKDRVKEIFEIHGLQDVLELRE